MMDTWQGRGRLVINDLLPALEAKSKSLGLALNRSKCAVYLPFGELLPTEFLPAIPRVGPDACLPVPGLPIP